MAALTKDRKTVYKDGDLVAYPVKASTEIFLGAMVCIDATGYAIPGSDTAGLEFVGVSQENADNSAGANGDISVQVRARGVHEFAASGLAITDVGADMYISDDQTVAASTTNSILAGKLKVFDTATNAPVELMPISGPVS